jgi:hypothetical protein
MTPLVISFYTKNTLYQLDIQNFLASCEQWGIEAHIEGIAPQASWELNCAYKPYFIYEKLREFQRPLLWVDADAVFHQKLEPCDLFSADLAVYIDPDLPPDHLSKVRSGTLFVNSTPQGIELVRRWAEECHQLMRSQKLFWDQVALRNVVLESKNFADIRPLPLAYVKIFDHPKDSAEVPSPIIVHYQASRRLKKTVTEL